MLCGDFQFKDTGRKDSNAHWKGHWQSFDTEAEKKAFDVIEFIQVLLPLWETIIVQVFTVLIKYPILLRNQKSINLDIKRI